MGTRSLTIVMEDQGVADPQPVACIYKQFDGYPSGLGKQLKDILGGFKVTNGYTMDDSRPEVRAANGMGCLAAHLVMELKARQAYKADELYPGSKAQSSIGGVYLQSPPEDPMASIGIEYVYTLSVVDGRVHVDVKSTYSGTLYSGPLDDLDYEALEKKEEEYA